jgi:cytochrome oxidase Cu insertion factor (SCO1/SenC/PrrC family)
MILSRPSYPLIGAMLAALAAIALAAYVAWQVSRPVPIATVGNSSSVAVSSRIKIGGPFELMDHMGNRVTDADFRGKLMLIYFGYGFCPDVCPTELQNLAAALDEMGEAAEAVQPIFITVDPERDTVDFLAEYVENFHTRLIGLTGTRQQIDAAATLYRVYHGKVKNDSDEDYFVDHSSFVYLMGQDGSFLTLFKGATDPKKIAETIAGYIDRRG